MVSSEAPKAIRAGSLMMEKTVVSRAAKISSRVAEVPRIFSAPSRSPAPRRMEARGAPPMPAKAVKAEISIRMGKVTPRPVRAVRPTSGMWPI